MASFRVLFAALAWVPAWSGCGAGSALHFPAAAAASPHAEEAPRADVTRALDSDPPLPGESTRGWSGLGQQNDPAPAQHHHHHHEHAPAPAPAPAPPSEHSHPAPGGQHAP